jgi:hypothetical protein
LAVTARFLAMLPTIQEQARFAFRSEPPERRQDLIAEVVANCWVAFVRLVERGLIEIVYPSPLAAFAVKQVRDGRRVGAKLNVRDVSSPYAQLAKGIIVERLDRYDPEENEWREVVIEDHRSGPAETAAARIDIADWFDSLPKHKRRVAKMLATGETTKTSARRFNVSPGRISQLRRELHESWQSLQGELGDG